MSETQGRHAPLADRFLDHLRLNLAAPALRYVQPLAAIRGGHDTQIFSFRLAGAPRGWEGPLVLRVLGGQHDPRRALRERAAQNAVADLGYPAPRVLEASADPAPLGSGFLVMERAAGRPMLDERPIGVARALADVQARLHALDAEPFLIAMDSAGGRGPSTFDGLLAQMAERVARRPHDGLRPAMDWLLAHRPATAARPTICHGDLHPQNVLMSGNAVTAVLDWPNAVVADPAYDVAATRVILAFVPMALLSIPAPLRGLAHVARMVMVARYTRAMRLRQPSEPRAREYYEAAACMRQLVRVWGARLVAAETRAPLETLDASSFGDRLGAHFARLTGVRPSLPAAR